MAGVTVRIPGQANIIETKAALMSPAVAHQFSVITGAPAAPNDKVRKPSAGDIGKRLQTARLA
jgi:hypothetical protein